MIEGVNGKYRYSIDPKDFENLDFEQFKLNYQKIFGDRLNEIWKNYGKKTKKTEV